MNRTSTAIHLFRIDSIVACGALSLWLVPTVVVAQEELGALEGAVFDRVTGQAVSAAVVAVRPSDLAVQTDQYGRFKVDAVTSGVHDLAIHAVGYADLLQPNIVVSAGRVTNVTVQLDPLPGSTLRTTHSTNAHTSPPNKSKVPFGFGVGMAAERRITSDQNSSTRGASRYSLVSSDTGWA